MRQVGIVSRYWRKDRVVGHGDYRHRRGTMNQPNGVAGRDGGRKDGWHRSAKLAGGTNDGGAELMKASCRRPTESGAGTAGPAGGGLASPGPAAANRPRPPGTGTGTNRRGGGGRSASILLPENRWLEAAATCFPARPNARRGHAEGGRGAGQAKPSLRAASFPGRTMELHRSAGRRGAARRSPLGRGAC